MQRRVTVGRPVAGLLALRVRPMTGSRLRHALAPPSLCRRNPASTPLMLCLTNAGHPHQGFPVGHRTLTVLITYVVQVEHPSHRFDAGARHKVTDPQPTGCLDMAPVTALSGHRSRRLLFKFCLQAREGSTPSLAAGVSPFAEGAPLGGPRCAARVVAGSPPTCRHPHSLTTPLATY